jgi:hypothetical protein
METKYPAKRLSEPSKQLASRKIRTMDMIVESLLLGQGHEDDEIWIPDHAERKDAGVM